MLAGFGPRVGIDEQTALRLARPFGGAVGMGMPCGAVAGALMVLGLSGGQAQDSDREARFASYARAREFARRFSARFGSIRCRDLLDLDLGEPGDYQTAQERDVFKQICPAFVRGAAEILEEMLAQKG